MEIKRIKMGNQNIGGKSSEYSDASRIRIQIGVNGASNYFEIENADLKAIPTRAYSSAAGGVHISINFPADAIIYNDFYIYATKVYPIDRTNCFPRH